jgi:hypothetical protein
MKLKEAIERINNSEELYYIDDAESVIDYETQLASNIDINRHRWYETSTSYFQLEDGILGIEGLSNVYSEYMLASDCDVNCYAFEGEEIKTVSYKPKMEN